MMDSLSEAFRRYTELVLAALRKHDVFDEHLRKTGISLLRPDRRIEFLPQVVEQLEGQKAFHWLLEETEAAFPDQSHTREISHVERATKHFFRRSAFYLDIFERRDIDIDRAFESYVKAFQKQEIPVRDLIPFEYVNFTFPSSRIKFDSFQILRFSEAELANILGDRVNRIFYRWAVIDVKYLSDYWFISTECLKFRLELIGPSLLDRLDFSRIGQIEPDYKRFVGTFGSPEHVLALFPWKEYADFKEEEWLLPDWYRYRLPFTIKVHDDLLNGPSWAPDLSVLQRDTRIYNLPTGDEIEEESRQICINFDLDATARFIDFVMRVENLFAAIKPLDSHWKFLETALAYLMKAMQSSEPEQLLWYITSLEALFGERGEGVTERLARRLSTVLGGTESEKEKIRKQFKDLYQLRSDLVHGNRFGKEVMASSLTTAWDLARRALLWFLHYLYAAQLKTGESQDASSIPSRDVLLKCLDCDAKTRRSLHQLIDKLPSGFPYVRDWRE